MVIVHCCGERVQDRYDLLRGLPGGQVVFGGENVTPDAGLKWNCQFTRWRKILLAIDNQRRLRGLVVGLRISCRGAWRQTIQTWGLPHMAPGARIDKPMLLVLKSRILALGR